MVEEFAKRTAESATEGGADPVEKVAAAIRSITASSGKTASGQKSEARNVMLDALVYGDNDLVGLVAYAMHEVNRKDWCAAYEAGNGRPPSDGEVKAYLVGEQLERRLDTYRRLAEDALAKIANPDQNMRRLVESAADGRATQGVAPAMAQIAGSANTQAPRPAPMPAPMPATIPRSLEVSPADAAIVPPPKRRNLGGFLFYLVLLLVAVLGVAWIIRNGLTLPTLTR